MQLPLSFNELGLWLAFTSIILLATYEILSRQNGQSTPLVDRKKLRAVALALGLLSTLTIAVVTLRLIISF
jgi:hypothetical protein